MHDDMSAKPCDNCKMIMANYADLWLVYSSVASLLDGAKLELRELKARSRLLDACTACPVLRSDLEAAALRLRILSTNSIFLLATLFCLLLVKHVSLSMVRFSMLSKRTPSFSRRLPI
jgi:hypothetical protein